MSLKKILGAVAIVLACSVPSFSNEITPALTGKPATTTPESARAEELVNRLEEIKAMDTKSLSRAEKRELRKEVRSIEKEMKTMNGGGVYISVGALLVIIILILIL